MAESDQPPLTREELEAMFRFDKSALGECDLAEQGNEAAYWATKTPAERIAALEYMRMILCGTDPAHDRLERVL